jgi:hypothetical protein
MESQLRRPWDLLSPTRATVRQTPPHRPTQSLLDKALKACQAGNPQIFTICTRLCPQACTGLHHLCCASLLPSGLPSHRSTGIHDLCSTRPMPPRPAQACTISTLLGHAPKACQAGDPHTHNLHSPGQCCQACTGLHRPA